MFHLQADWTPRLGRSSLSQRTQVRVPGERHREASTAEETQEEDDPLGKRAVCSPAA